MKLPIKTGTLYVFARKLRDLEVVVSGSPKKMFKRFVINRFLGKHVVRRTFSGGIIKKVKPF